MTDIKYLHDLAERIMAIPVVYGVDQGDVDRLNRIARKLERMVEDINNIERDRNARLEHNLGDD